MYLLNLCHSIRRLRFEYDISEADFLEGTLREAVTSLNLVQVLPYNYRPPSSFGDSVPISSNIYNAAPGLPRYHDIFQISKSTGSYKACLNKSERAFCGCDDLTRLSMDSLNSDCIDRVCSNHLKC